VKEKGDATDDAETWLTKKRKREGPPLLKKEDEGGREEHGEEEELGRGRGSFFSLGRIWESSACLRVQTEFAERGPRCLRWGGGTMCSYTS